MKNCDEFIFYDDLARALAPRDKAPAKKKVAAADKAVADKAGADKAGADKAGADKVVVDKKPAAAPVVVARPTADRKSVVEGKGVSGRVESGGRRIIEKKKKT